VLGSTFSLLKKENPGKQDRDGRAEGGRPYPVFLFFVNALRRHAAFLYHPRFPAFGISAPPLQTTWKI
jgi:hypothetical protein